MSLVGVKEEKEKEPAPKTITYQMNRGMYCVDEYWMALRNVCTSTPLRRTEKGKSKALTEPELSRPDMFK